MEGGGVFPPENIFQREIRNCYKKMNSRTLNPN